MNIGEINRRLADARLVYLLAAVLLAIAIWGGVKRFRPQAQLMFVQSAEALKVDPAASTFRLVNVSQQPLFFSDRPQRIAGHYKMADYLKEWSEGKDNFGEDPPNATLSVYEPGQADQSLVVVEINNPVIDGADLIYSYKVLDGTMPASGGARLGCSLIGLRRAPASAPAGLVAWASVQELWPAAPELEALVASGGDQPPMSPD